MDSDLKQNVTSSHLWLRLVYMVLFGVVLHVTMALFWFVAVVQFLFALLCGKPNEKLQSFSSSLGQYIAQCVHFETFVSEHKPFPFSDFPEPQAPEQDQQVVQDS